MILIIFGFDMLGRLHVIVSFSFLSGLMVLVQSIYQNCFQTSHPTELLGLKGKNLL